MRTFLAAFALAVLTAMSTPVSAGSLPGDVDLKAPDGAPKLFDTLRENNE